MKRRGLGIGVLLQTSSFFLIILPILALGFAGFRLIQDDTAERNGEELKQRALMTVQNIQGLYDNAQSKVVSDLTLARYVFETAGSIALDTEQMLEIEATNQISLASESTRIPTMEID